MLDGLFSEELPSGRDKNQKGMVSQKVNSSLALM
jgi:hypothetical protein